MGWGKGKGGWGFHHHHGPGLLGVAAEAAVVGGVTAAVVASTVARPKPKPRCAPAVVVVQQPAAPAQPVYVTGGYVHHKGKGKGKKGPPIVVAAQPEEPLNVASVSLPPDFIEMRGDTTFYGVEVTPEQGAKWRVMRRYNEFHDLMEKLGSVAKSFPGAPFPPKHFFGMNNSQLEGRRRGLEVWLTSAIRNPSSGGAWLRPLREFLHSGREFIAAGAAPASAPPPAAPPAAAPAAAPASAPAPAGPPAAPPAESPAEGEEYGEDEGAVLEIEIPAGVTPGQYLGVTVPDGRQLTVEVPQGMAAGAKMQLWFDVASGTLSPMT